MSDELWRRGAGGLAELIAAGRCPRGRSCRPTWSGSRRSTATQRDRRRARRRSARRGGRGRRERRPGTGSAARRPVHGQGEHRRRGHADDVRRRGAGRGDRAARRAQVERLRAAGAIPIGRTNLPDLGLRIHTDSSLRGRPATRGTRRVTAGGSQRRRGGRAGVGHDPARPRQRRRRLAAQPRALLRDRLDQADARPRAPRDRSSRPEDLGPGMQLMAVEGVMARRVADVRLGLSIVAGMHPRDPESVPVPLDVPRSARGRSRCWRSRPAATPTRRSRPPSGAPATRSPTPATTSSRPSRRSTRRR